MRYNTKLKSTKDTKNSVKNAKQSNAKQSKGKKSADTASKKKKNGFFSRIKTKAKSFVKKYVPSMMVLFSGATATAQANEMQSFDLSSVRRTTLVTPESSVISYNDIKLDLNTIRPEALSMVFMSNCKFNAVYAPKGKTPTIENATGFGPLLTRVNVLQNFIQANKDKYAKLNQTIANHGLNSKAFEKAWNDLSPDQQKELIKDLMGYTWRSSYQPVFNKLANQGYPKITFENYTNVETFGYTMAVISCLGQSSRQTVDIFTKAKERADNAFGKNATLDDYIDCSYDIRNERWGLDTRYFGRDGKSGEKALNKQIRNTLKEVRTATYRENPYFSKYCNDAHVVPADAIKQVFSDSALHESIRIENAKIQKYDFEPNRDLDKAWKERMLESKNKKATETDSIQNVSLTQDMSFIQDILKQNNLFFANSAELTSHREQLAQKLAEAEKSLNAISSDVYTIMGRKINVQYGSFSAESVGHVYESAMDPTMKDAANSALGKYQFNLNNTMKVLADDLADEFPELKQVKNQYGVKSKQYEAVWKKYSTGPNKQRFEYRQLEFMWGKFYQKSFDYMTKSCKMPKITLENYNNPEVRVYTAAMMSLVNQNPKKSTQFMERAYNRVARGLTNGQKPNPNTVGLVSYDVRDAAWGGKNRALHRRYMGGGGIIGEKELCNRMLRYDNESPRLIAQIADLQKQIYAVDYALNSLPKIDLQKPATKQKDLAQNKSLKNKMDKVVSIQKHAKNIKELHSLRKRVRHNLAKVLEEEENLTAINTTISKTDKGMDKA